jgi:hypothetical protein
LFPERFEITYMAGMEREPGVHVPIRLISKSLPRHRYIVQKVDGGVEGTLPKAKGDAPQSATLLFYKPNLFSINSLQKKRDGELPK